MEERKRRKPLCIIGCILLVLILAVLCFAASDPSAWLPTERWSILTTDENTVFQENAALFCSTDDLLVCDRSAADGSFSLTVDQTDGVLTVAVPETEEADAIPVIYVLRYGGIVLKNLIDFQWIVWGVSAALILMLIVLRVTASARWRKRQQKLMRENFRVFGEKYQKEDEELKY